MYRQTELQRKMLSLQKRVVFTDGVLRAVSALGGRKTQHSALVFDCLPNFYFISILFLLFCSLFASLSSIAQIEIATAKSNETKAGKQRKTCGQARLFTNTCIRYVLVRSCLITRPGLLSVLSPFVSLLSMAYWAFQT